jgi:hypothetical protein
MGSWRYKLYSIKIKGTFIMSYNPARLWDEPLSMGEHERLPMTDTVPEFFGEVRSIPVFSQEGELLDLDSLLEGLFTPPDTMIIFDIQD